VSEERALADDLIGDADISALRVPGFRGRHRVKSGRWNAAARWCATGAGRMLRAPTVFEDVVKTI
jgi:hypothetical protein